MRVMSVDADESDVRRFLEEARRYTTPEQKQNADAVLQVSSTANRKLYIRLKEDDDMCQALREIMSDELRYAQEQGVEQATEQTEIKSVKNLMESLGLSAKDAMNALKLSADKQKKYAAML